MKYLKYTLTLISVGLLMPLAGFAQPMFEGPAPGLQSVVIDGYMPEFGHLVKIENDGDPNTTIDSAVYYIDSDLSRRAFPNQYIYESWYEDFSEVREISAEDMAKIRLSGNIRYRPGTRLVKIPSIPKVYAVEPGGVLRWIETEAVAKELFGDNWAKRVDDVSETFFMEYTEGTPLVAPVWPTGTIVRRASDTALFLIEGMGKRHIMPGAASLIRAQERYVIATDSDLSQYDDIGSVSETDARLTDAGEYFRIETLPPAVFDFPVDLSNINAGEEVNLYVMRAISGTPIILRGMTVNITGASEGGRSLLTDLHWTDGYGNDLFGLKQLESTESGSEVFVMSGARTMSENMTALYTLKATLADDAPEGHVITVSFNRGGLKVADGGNGNSLDRFWPLSDFPEFELEVVR